MGGRGGGRGQRGGPAGRGGGQARRVVAIVPPGPGANKQTPKKPATLDARFTQLAQRRAETGQRVATARYAATMAKRTGQSAKQFAAKPVAVAGKGPKSAAAKKAKKGVAVGRAKVQVKAVTAVRRTSVKAVGAAAKAAKKAKKPPKKAAAPKPKPKKAPAAKKPAPAPKKAPKKANKPKKVKPEPPKPEDLDKDLDSYMAAAPVGDAMTA